MIQDGNGVVGYFENSSKNRTICVEIPKLFRYFDGMNSIIQLPDDVTSIGYRQTGRFEWSQVFRSSALAFEGTEQEFLDAGHAYRYVQMTPFTRLCA